ncbi:acyl-CoA dehydrogenase family protein [Massilia putida]|uniref:acyl-CoA dehydrogenase family protein n=1 Tax=Massilia putida TaxID=1141883 RepID=UPI0014759E97|nr:acyl-CoA dehydrogenase family protein [Massilia putida]
MLRDNARRFLSETATFERWRRHLDSGAGLDRALWREVAELGWSGAAVPETFGGLGLGPMELCVLAEELGRVLAPLPFIGTASIAVDILSRSPTPEGNALLERIATGDAVIAVAGLDADQPASKLVLRDGRVDGSLGAVAWLEQADYAIVYAGEPDTPSLLLVDLAGAGVERRTLRLIDPLLPHGSLTLTQAATTVLARGAQARELHARARNLGAVLTAFEQIGAADTACALAVAYVKERHAFGRPVGAYQAVKHKLADMAVKTELARSNCYFGAWALVDGPDELDLAAAAARVSAIDALDYAAQECLHLHGGIGYTWEANCHFYYTRARVLASSLGNAALWGERLLHAATAQR